MNHILTILNLLAASGTIWGKPIHIGDEDAYSRYAYNFAMNDLNTGNNKALWEARDIQSMNSMLQPGGNLGLVEYNVDDNSAFNAIVQKLASSLNPTPLFGPLPLPLPPVNPLIDPLNYGFGATTLPKTFPKVTVTGSSLPWDPRTRSYGGWVPLRGPLSQRPMAKLVTKKYINGHLYRVRSRPIPLNGKTIIIKRRPALD